jgi:hypothetical protein
MFAAAKNPSQPDKTLPALMLFKVNLIISLIVAGLFILLSTIISVALIIAGYKLQDALGNSGFDIPQIVYDIIGVATLIGVGLLVLIAIMVVIIVFYYKALLSLLKGIREGITKNTRGPLPGVILFTVFTCISVASALITAIATAVAIGFLNAAVSNFLNEFLNEFLYSLDIPVEVWGYIDGFIEGFVDTEALFGSPITGLLPVVRNAGILMLIISLNLFNGRLKAKAE